MTGRLGWLARRRPRWVIEDKEEEDKEDKEEEEEEEEEDKEVGTPLHAPLR